MPGKKEKQPLSVTHPELAKEADDWDPSTVTFGSNKKLEWKCNLGHRWASKVFDRARGKGCPYCSGRKAINGTTDLLSNFPDVAAQANGWDPSTVTAHSGKKLEWKCASGHIWSTTVGSRTSGIGCPYCAGKLPIIGETDLLTLSPDIAAEANGWNPSLVTMHSGKKLSWKCASGHIYIKSVDQRQRYGCPFCSGKFPIVGETDLQTLYPEIAKQADGWNPEEFLSKSNEVQPWICVRGHKFKAAIATRTDPRATGNGCPYCSGRRVIPGETDLQSINPKLALEAHGWDPNKVSPGSDRKLKWKCARGHIWEAAVFSRNTNTGCPFCANQKVLKGFNDLATTAPDLAKEALPIVKSHFF